MEVHKFDTSVKKAIKVRSHKTLSLSLFPRHSNSIETVNRHTQRERGKRRFFFSLLVVGSASRNLLQGFTSRHFLPGQIRAFLPFIDVDDDDDCR